MDWLDQLRSGRAVPAAMIRNYEEEKPIMDGYTQLRSRVDRFLKDNPDVQLVTLKRPAPKNKRTYANGNAECYGRMPESCPVVNAILQNELPDDLVITRGDGSRVSAESLRDLIFSRIHTEVTGRFRSAFEEVCDQKHILLNRLRNYQRQVRDWIEEAETEIPEPPQPRTSRSRGRSNEVEFEIDDDDESL